MERPNKKDYLSCNQIEYHARLNQYYEDLEKYVEHLESGKSKLLHNLKLRTFSDDCSNADRFADKIIDFIESHNK